MQLLWEGRSAHRSSRSAALRPTPPLGARFTPRERVGAAAELRGGKAGLYTTRISRILVLSHVHTYGTNTFRKNCKRGRLTPTYGTRPTRWASLFPLGCGASACCLPVHEQPAEAGRLVTEVDGGEEAWRRRGAIVSAALYLPMLCPQPAERARVEHTVVGVPDHAMRGAQQSPRCELTEHGYSIRCQVHVHAVVDPQRGAEPLRRAQGGGVACRSIAPNPSVSGRGSCSPIYSIML